MAKGNSERPRTSRHRLIWKCFFEAEGCEDRAQDLGGISGRRAPTTALSHICSGELAAEAGQDGRNG